jgi:uncharacterized protein with PQ loop repeat
VINLLLQAVAVVVTAIAWLPQTIKSLRAKSVAGVSVSSWAVGAITGLVFCLYGIKTSVWSLTVSEGAFAVGAALLISTIQGVKKTAAYVALAVLLSLLAVLLLTPIEVGVVGIAGSLGMRVLQIGKTLRTKSVAGMSSWSWALLALNVTAWGLFGLRTNRWPLVVTSAVALSSAVFLLKVARHYQKTNGSIDYQ